MTTRDELVEALVNETLLPLLDPDDPNNFQKRVEVARAAIAIVVERCAKISGDIEARGPGIGHERYPITRAINALADPRP